jgi:hypothetical protein
MTFSIPLTVIFGTIILLSAVLAGGFLLLAIGLLMTIRESLPELHRERGEPASAREKPVPDEPDPHSRSR